MRLADGKGRGVIGINRNRKMGARCALHDAVVAAAPARGRAVLSHAGVGAAQVKCFKRAGDRSHQSRGAKDAFGRGVAELAVVVGAPAFEVAVVDRAGVQTAGKHLADAGVQGDVRKIRA